MNFLKDLKTFAIKELEKNNIFLNEARIEVELLMEHVFGLKPKDLLLNPEIKIPQKKEQKFTDLIKKRIEKNMPVQYLTNKAYFMNEVFYVDENVLIPRPETEILVEEVLKRADKNLKIIDIGTGSGCIAIMLAKNLPNADFTASDISRNALKIAKYNAEKSGTAEKIRFIQSNIFKNFRQDEKFDIIVSNPPYIAIKEKQTLQPEVHKHEPGLALFTDDEDGLSFYKELTGQSFSMLNTGGILAVEVGFSQSEAVSNILKSNNYADIEIIKDLSGVKRVVIGKFS